MEIVPVLAALVVLAAAEKEIVPFPDPRAAEVIVIQAACVLAVHAHPVEKLTVPVPPPIGIVVLVGVNVTVQFAGLWLSVNAWVPT
jgi:hypothetical protein